MYKKLQDLHQQAVDRHRNCSGPQNDQPFGANLHIGVRHYFDTKVADGYRDFIRISPSAFITLNSFIPKRDIHYRLAGEDAFLAHFQLSGRNYSEFTDNSSFEIRGARALIAHHPSGVNETESFPAGVEERSVTISCAPKLVSEFNSGKGSLPHHLRKIVYGKANRFTAEGLYLMPRMSDILNCMLSLKTRGNVRRLHIEALTMEILCESFSFCMEQQAWQEYPDLSARDIKKIFEVHTLLSSSFPKTLSIPEIANISGLNRNKLCRGFKTVFDQTIGEYCLHQRMQKAAELLQSNSTVKSIAQSIGYESLASFSTAFRRHYHISPSEYRKQA